MSYTLKRLNIFIFFIIVFSFLFSLVFLFNNFFGGVSLEKAVGDKEVLSFLKENSFEKKLLTTEEVEVLKNSDYRVFYENLPEGVNIIQIKSLDSDLNGYLIFINEETGEVVSKFLARDLDI